jgi:hypothetical protein
MSTEQVLNYITLKEACPSATTNTTSKTEINNLKLRFPNLNYNDPEVSLQDEYFNSVEKANEIIPQIENIEKKFFIDKYGEKIYNYLIQKRNEYINNKTTQSSSTTSDTISNINLIKNLKDDISHELDIYNELYKSETNTKINNYKYAIKKIEKSIKDMNNKSEISNRKLVYRNDVIHSYMNLNYILTGIYFLIIFIIFILLFLSNKLNLTTNWFVYLIVIIFPFVYNYIFKFIIYLSVKINEKINYNGPKNAFVRETSSYDSIIDKYNI